MLNFVGWELLGLNCSAKTQVGRFCLCESPLVIVCGFGTSEYEYNWFRFEFQSFSSPKMKGTLA